jgi:hypothetical protein
VRGSSKKRVSLAVEKVKLAWSKETNEQPDQPRTEEELRDSDRDPF